MTEHRHAIRHILLLLFAATFGLACQGPMDLPEILGTEQAVLDAGDYSVESVLNTGTTIAGGAITGSFLLSNTGSEDDTDGCVWQVHVSTDAILGAGDALVDTGSLQGLAAGASVEIGFSGIWPDLAGVWCLIVSVSSPGDKNATNDARAGTTLNLTPRPDPAYDVASVATTGGAAGLAFSSSFQVHESSGGTGQADFEWAVYLSAEPTLSGGAVVLWKDVEPPLDAGETRDIDFTGTWPPVDGTYYFHVMLQARDVPAQTTSFEVTVTP